MEFKSIFDIIGPIMVGPSSSHTAGALKIARYARQKFGEQPDEVEITLYNSFAKTYKGHGTDVALVGGILNFESDNLAIPNALSIAEKAGIEIRFNTSDRIAQHPNTVTLVLVKASDEERSLCQEAPCTRQTQSSSKPKILEVTGISIGGGSFKIVGERNV